MRRLFILVFSILYILFMITEVMAQENGWRNLTWGMDWREVRETLKCDKECSPYYFSDSMDINILILLHHGGIEFRGSSMDLEKLHYFDCTFSPSRETFEKLLVTTTLFSTKVSL